MKQGHNAQSSVQIDSCHLAAQAWNTWLSESVSHQSNNKAQPCLASEIGHKRGDLFIGDITALYTELMMTLLTLTIATAFM